MTVVLVHGNPESEAIWGPLRAEWGRDDIVCLSPPGFGAPVPAGFGATAVEYRDWLTGELERFGEPVHLVGHDWGGGHVVNVAMSRPDLLRSWATDILGAFDPDYVWQDLARTWQQHGPGEELVASMMSGTLEQRADRFPAPAASREVAEAVAAAQTPEMGRCILALYRSAAQPALSELGRALPAAAARPGLGIVAEADRYVGTRQQHERAAARAGARLETLPGLGHWWMLEDPARGAELLDRFVREVDG